MNEFEHAQKLKKNYENAKKSFEHVAIPVKLDNIDFEKLKLEVEKIGFKISLAKDIKDSFWQKESKKNKLAVFYLNETDV